MAMNPRMKIHKIIVERNLPIRLMENFIGYSDNGEPLWDSADAAAAFLGAEVHEFSQDGKRAILVWDFDGHGLTIGGLIEAHGDGWRSVDDDHFMDALE